MNNRLLRMI